MPSSSKLRGSNRIMPFDEKARWTRGIPLLGLPLSNGQGAALHGLDQAADVGSFRTMHEYMLMDMDQIFVTSCSRG